MALSTTEDYWNRRALAETKAALGCDDAHVASIHVDLATRCVRQCLLERERIENDADLVMTPRQAVTGQR
ncbi:MAG: hypothetical protein ACR2JJ_00500 [Sphingomicrobium sp.]